MERWSLQDAKAKFSELVRLVKADGPRIVTLRGKPEIVIMTLKEYEALRASKPSLIKMMASSPLSGMELEVSRSQSAREFDV